jgi:hypothetical protein
MRACALVVLVASSALAAPGAAAPNRKQAALHFQRGIVLYEENNFAAALTEFRAAYEAAPSFEVLFNIGLCQRRLFQYGEAVATLEAYLRQAGNKLPKDRRAAVSLELAEVRSLTAPVTVLAPGGTASVSVDGELVGFTPLQGVLVGSGPKVFRVEREGFETQEQKREIVSGQAVQLKFDLKPLATADQPVAIAPTPAAAASPPRAEATARASDPPGRPVNAGLVLGIAGLAVGAAAIGGGIALSVEAGTVSKEITRLSETGGTWDDSWTAREQWGKTARTLGPLAIVVGAGLVVAGGISTAFSAVIPPQKPGLTGVWVAPLPEGGGLVGVGGRL